MTESKEIRPWKAAIKDAKPKFGEVNVLNMNYMAEAMFATQALQKNAFLLKIANEAPGSLRNAVINVAAVGLSLNPATAYAYLVPRDGMVMLDISYKGLIKIATDSGSILFAKAELVYENDSFEWCGPAAEPIHKADVFAKDRGDFKGCYCIAKTKEGDILTEIMSADDIYQVRNTSKAYTAGKGSPWDNWFGEMTKKTVIKRAAKTWPKSDKTERLDTAIQVLNEHEGLEDLPTIGTDPIDWELVDSAYSRALDLIDGDILEDDIPAMAQSIVDELSQDEHMALHDRLRQHRIDETKGNSKKYSTVFKEYIADHEKNLLTAEVDAQYIDM